MTQLPPVEAMEEQAPIDKTGSKHGFEGVSSREGKFSSHTYFDGRFFTGGRAFATASEAATRHATIKHYLEQACAAYPSFLLDPLCLSWLCV